MITNAEEQKGRWVALFWAVILGVFYFWGLPRLNGIWKALPSPSILQDSPASEAQKKTESQIFDPGLYDPGRYANVVPIGPPTEEPPKRPILDPERYSNVVPIPPTEEPPPRPIR